MCDERGALAYPYSGGAHVVGAAGVGDYVAQSGAARPAGGRGARTAVGGQEKIRRFELWATPDGAEKKYVGEIQIVHFP